MPDRVYTADSWEGPPPSIQWLSSTDADLVFIARTTNDNKIIYLHSSPKVLFFNNFRRHKFMNTYAHAWVLCVDDAFFEQDRGYNSVGGYTVVLKILFNSDGIVTHVSELSNRWKHDSVFAKVKGFLMNLYDIPDNLMPKGGVWDSIP